MADAPGVINREKLAALLMMTPRNLSRLVADGWIQKTEDDKYTVVGGVQGHIRYMRDTARRGMTSTSDQELKSERSATLRLKREHLQGNLIELEEHRALFAEFAGTIRVMLAQLPAEITRDQGERTRIEAICDRTLADLAARFEQSARDLAAYRSTAEAGATPEPGRVGQEE